MPRRNRSRRVSAVPKGNMRPWFNELMNRVEGFVLIGYFGSELQTFFFLVVQIGVVNLARFMLHIMVCYNLMTKVTRREFDVSDTKTGRFLQLQVSFIKSLVSSGLGGGVWAGEQIKHRTCSRNPTAIRRLLWQCAGWTCLLGILNWPSVVPESKGLGFEKLFTI